MKMTHRNMCAPRLAVVLAAGLCFSAAGSAQAAAIHPGAQGAGTPPGAAPETPPAADKPPMKQEELDQLLAPIALYPDALVSQILMASTYPLEVIEADRWVKKNEKLTGDALAKALEAQTWDASVKSLVNFPQVLTQMSEDLEWMTKLGDAFIGQQKQVMDTVQSLRAKAKDAGNLESNEQQTVTVEKESGTQVIVIESKSPDVIYVPTYDTKVVYGAWPYPAYPPYYYYPPAYAPGTALVSFGVGVACGLAWGYAWGNCNWGHGDVNINVNQNFNRNTNINRNNINANIKNGQWQHDSSHRKGVSYRDNATSQKFGKAGSRDAVQARDQFRGRAEAGQRDIDSGRVNSGNVGSERAGTASDRTGTSAGTRDTSRSGSSGASRDSSRSGSGSGSGGGAFSGSGGSGSEARTSSNRGKTSRSSSSGGRSSGGGSRGGGGGGRGGGGRR